ncbi:Ankyrin repeat [Parelusimicrobium proximum]|uniref:ankyrin repeat domain-containing protein n=1 Tax=Parelusimicrobium proximum TaxID=3228953 RepID=UPI003D1712C3
MRKLLAILAAVLIPASFAAAQEYKAKMSDSYNATSKAIDNIMTAHLIRAGQNEVHAAVIRPLVIHEDIAHAVKNGADLNKTDSVGFTPLMYAVYLNKAATVEYLLYTMGADASVKDTLGRQAIHYAKNEEILSILTIYANSDINVRDFQGDTPILVYIKSMPQNQNVSVKIFLSQGADPALASWLGGANALHSAAAKGNTFAALEILEIKPELINKTDLQGNTPLHIAAREGNLAMTELLVGYGADVFAKNKKGDTPYLAALTPKRVSYGTTVLDYDKKDYTNHASDAKTVAAYLKNLMKK